MFLSFFFLIFFWFICVREHVAPFWVVLVTPVEGYSGGRGRGRVTAFSARVCLPDRLSTWLAWIPICVPGCLPASLCARLTAWLLACLTSCLRGRLPACQPVFFVFFLWRCSVFLAFFCFSVFVGDFLWWASACLLACTLVCLPACLPARLLFLVCVFFFLALVFAFAFFFMLIFLFFIFDFFSSFFICVSVCVCLPVCLLAYVTASVFDLRFFIFDFLVVF